MEGMYIDPSLPVTRRHDIYPAIDPQHTWTTKAYVGKVVLVTGASRGIGQTLAVFYAKAGAALALVARSSLDATETAIREEVPGATVLVFSADVTNTERAREVVQSVVQQLGRLDIVVANAGTGTGAVGKRMGEADPAIWWNTFEVNVKGTFNFVSPSLEHLESSKGYVLVISSRTAQARHKTHTDYMTSKHTLGRLVELIPFEYPTISAFSLHPGGIPTKLSLGSGAKPEFFTDTAQLAAGTALVLTSGRFDWLSGRFVDSTWDLDEVERDWKEKIVEKGAFGALVNKFALP